MLLILKKIWCFITTENFFIENISNLANAIIALANLFLAYYVLVYQKKKDVRDRRLQGIKELIIQPNLNSFILFFSQVETIALNFTQSNITMDQKLVYSQDIKDEFSRIRLSFVEIIRSADVYLADFLQNELDDLVDTLTDNLFNQGINLSHLPAFEQHIKTPLLNTKSIAVSRIIAFVS